MSKSFSNLPEEISQEILVRLPVKSLLRFKCVSKYLYSFIGSTYFIKKHMNHSIQKNNTSFVLSEAQFRNRKSQFISLQSVLALPPSNKRDHGVVVNRRHFSFLKKGWKIHSFPGSSDGLLCICCVSYSIDDFDDSEDSDFFEDDYDPDNQEKIVILNPSTREFKEISVPQRGRRESVNFDRGDRTRSLYWFGYDCKIDDYKLIRVVGFDIPGKDSFEVEVCTLGSGSWEKIDNVCYKFDKEHLGVLVHGALHWFVVVCGGAKQLKALVSFDISNERFVEVPLPKEPLTYPEEPLEDAKYGKIVGELGGHLCLLFHVFGVRVDVWVMQEYGAVESWTKSFTITEEIITKTFCPRIKWSFMDSKILFQGDDKLILYDPEHERYTRLALCVTNDDAASYVTSLVSVNSGTYLKQVKNKKKRRSKKESGRDFY